MKKLLDSDLNLPDNDQKFAYYAGVLATGLGAQDLSSASRFLQSLRISVTSGDEIGLRAFVIEEVARPILVRLGLQPAAARKVYNAAFSLVVEAVNGLDVDAPNGVWASRESLVEEERSRRTITRSRLVAALVAAGIPITSDSHIGGEFAISAMSRKLRAGRVGPTVLRSAPRLRRDWFEVEAAYRSDVPTRFGDEVRRIRSEVANRAGMAESATRVPGRAYGMEMHRELSKLLGDSTIKPNLPVGPPELMGCVYQLTDECEVWWSDEFNANGEAPWTLAPPAPEQLALIPKDYEKLSDQDDVR
ncbi:hypothetical protein [Nonomuraea helvata]|uniref:Uncharacterized protein n=1 Tax=Nonomuraea helvata TaxID=37484 RepID=A0ABV5SH11_9ACTN